MNQLTLDIGHTLKREGQAAVINADWAACALSALRKFLATKPHNIAFAIEDFRAWAINSGELAPPAHHNAWGAVPRIATNEGLIRWTGMYRPARSALTHAHPVRLYVREAA